MTTTSMDISGNACNDMTGFMTNDGVKLQDLLHNDWKSILKSSIESDNFQNLAKKVADAYSKETVYPSKEELFEAFH